MTGPGDGDLPGDAGETWIGVVRSVGAGDRVALAWVRHRDEWLADAAIARRGDEIATLAHMYEAAVHRRGHAPDRHHALHLLARVLMRQMSRVLTSGRAFDDAAYVAELRELAP